MSAFRRPWLVAVLAILIAVIVVPVGAVAGWWVYAHHTVVTVESITGGALVSSDGRTVAVSGVVGCDATDTLRAAEQPGRVTLTLDYVHLANPPCSGIPGFAVYRARLQAPLGRRALVDAATGRPVPYFDASSLDKPGYLPPGYAFRYAAPDAFGLFGGEYLAVPVDARLSCSQIYSPSDDYDLLVITQADGGRLVWPAGVKPRKLTVRGRPALAIPGRISWVQDGQLIVVATNNPELRLPELVAVADSMK